VGGSSAGPVLCETQLSVVTRELSSAVVTRGQEPPSKPEDLAAERLVLFFRKGSENSHCCYLELRREGAPERNSRT